MTGPRILLLVPHPDDEVVASAASVARVRAGGAQFFALYLTHGCIAKDTLWPWQRSQYAARVERRLGEARRVAAAMNVTPISFSDRPARHLWQNLYAVYREVLSAIAAYDIEQVWVPAYEGGNADHDALNAIGWRLSQECGLSVIEFAEYNYIDRTAHSQAFPYTNGTETVLTLTDDEKQAKAALLAMYESEQCNLGYVRTDHEVSRPIVAYDYARPAHPGVLWYARFQWVPFRHPRVDFTNPHDVCAAIQSFLSFGRANDLPEPATR